ncbi:MAG: hypothetical protein Q8Q56_01780 [Alphaproteobacteria bacterium]|nr:hypothetical protein [Alphaproteobacteria bacterium]
MKKILAAIVVYKLNKDNLFPLVQKIINELKNTSYPDTFKNKLSDLIKEIQEVSHQDILSLRDEEGVMDTLREMELLIVDYLSYTSVNQTNDCFFH